jgi:hypothetical protein
MKKLLCVLLFAAVVAGIPLPVFAGVVSREYLSQSPVVMPDGAPVHKDFVRFKNGEAYVFIGAFTGFPDVYAFNDLGSGASWDPARGDNPGKKTSVAMLRQVNDGQQKTLIVVNKATGEVFVETEKGSAPKTEVIIENNNVYLPLKATSELLNGRVDYDTTSGLAIVRE